MHIGTSLLRSRLYLGFGLDESPADFVDFLLLQQRHEGGYGFFGNTDKKLRTANGVRFCADLDLYLPMTLSCLWALAEACGDWQLYSSVAASDLLPAGRRRDIYSPCGSATRPSLEFFDDCCF